MEVTRISAERISFLNVTGNLLDESKVCGATVNEDFRGEPLKKERLTQMCDEKTVEVNVKAKNWRSGCA